MKEKLKSIGRKVGVVLVMVFFLTVMYPTSEARCIHITINWGPIITLLKEIINWAKTINHTVESVVHHLNWDLVHLSDFYNDFLKKIEKELEQEKQTTNSKYSGTEGEIDGEYGSVSPPPSQNVVSVRFNPQTGKWETITGGPLSYAQVKTYARMLTGGYEPEGLKGLTKLGEEGKLAYNSLKTRRMEAINAVLESMREAELSAEYEKRAVEIAKRLSSGVETGEALQLQGELVSITAQLLAQTNRLLAQQNKLLAILVGRQIKEEEIAEKKVLEGYEAIEKVGEGSK